MLAIVLAACLGQSGGAASPISPPVNLAESAKIRFADALMREAYLIVSPTDLIPAEIEAAIYLSLRSARILPEEAARWRSVLAMSGLGGEGLGLAGEANAQAIARLAQLCPADQPIRLRRLVMEVEKRETAQARVQAYKSFLTPEAIKAIGHSVASRLSFDLALLESRMGDVDGFANDLSKSLLMSPSFPAAAETAAGFIAERIDDPVGECELLVTAALANPIEERSWTRLSALLMQEGAYNSAVRVIGLAVDCARTDRVAEKNVDVMIGDLALALWGAGRIEDAAVALKKRLNENRDQFTAAVQSFNPGFTKADAESIPGPVAPILTTIAAGIERTNRSPATLDAVRVMIASVLDQIKVAEQLAKRNADSGLGPKTPDPSVAAAAAAELLDVTTSGALLGADEATLTAAIGEIEKRAPLTQEAKDRFSAWGKLRAGDFAAAFEAFDKAPAQSVSIRFGRAEALEGLGKRQDAARAFLSIAAESRGTLIGLLADDRLKSLVTTGIGPTAAVKAIDGVVASIPSTMERFLSQSRPAVQFTVTPKAKELKPFDPILYTLTIKNLTTLTLAVTPEGPIKEFVLLQPLLIVPGKSGPERLVPVVIPFDRAIELAPGESMSLDWNFAWSGVGLRTALASVQGSSLSFRGASNFTAGAGYFHVGAFGAEPVVADIDIEGVKVTTEWIDSAIAAASNPTTDSDLVMMALLTHALKGEQIPTDKVQAVSSALAQGFPKLPSDAQAWLILIAPRSPVGLEGMLANVSAASSSDVLCAYLLNLCNALEDPQLAAARPSSDQFVQLAVGMVEAKFQRETARAEERMRGEKRESQAGARDEGLSGGTSRP